jgi:hypothetical protein
MLGLMLIRQLLENPQDDHTLGLLLSLIELEVDKELRGHAVCSGNCYVKIGQLLPYLVTGKFTAAAYRLGDDCKLLLRVSWDALQGRMVVEGNKEAGYGTYDFTTLWAHEAHWVFCLEKT